MTAYYNEFDPFAAAWLRELIKCGNIAPGDVDERSIVDIRPADLIGYTQCHFFAGIGVWSYALRRAGWPDDRPVWTGSCPCQPFSTAGKGSGFADERHLWPAFHHLIEQCGPTVVFGEQVASKDGLAWLDLVQTDLEATGYAFGAVDTCAAGFGAPHIRQRLYWVADANERRQPRSMEVGRSGYSTPPTDREIDRVVDASRCGGMAFPDSAGLQPGQRDDQAARHGHSAATESTDGGLANAEREGERRRGLQRPDQGREASGTGTPTEPIGASPVRDFGWPRTTNGHWRDVDWLFCRDGKWRPVEPGTFPLAHGAAARVGRLRGYGNAIVAQAAQAFIEAYM